ncbi:MAG: hypothetical protein QXS41_03640 [Candidatus Woesearchaeota archaeon]
MSTYLAKEWHELQKLVMYLLNQGVDFSDEEQMKRLGEVRESILEMSFRNLRQNDLEELRDIINYVKNGSREYNQKNNFYYNDSRDSENVSKQLRKEYMSHFNENSSVKNIDDLFMSFLTCESGRASSKDNYKQEYNPNYSRSDSYERRYDNLKNNYNSNTNNNFSKNQSNLDSLLEELLSQVQKEYRGNKSVDNKKSDDKYLEQNKNQKALDASEKPEPLEFYWPSKKKENKDDQYMDSYTRRKKEEEKRYRIFDDDENPFF